MVDRPDNIVTLPLRGGDAERYDVAVEDEPYQLDVRLGLTADELTAVFLRAIRSRRGFSVHSEGNGVKITYFRKFPFVDSHHS